VTPPRRRPGPAEPPFGPSCGPPKLEAARAVRATGPAGLLCRPPPSPGCAGGRPGGSLSGHTHWEEQDEMAPPCDGSESAAGPAGPDPSHPGPIRVSRPAIRVSRGTCRARSESPGPDPS
jgi:hypothetical protein